MVVACHVSEYSGDGSLVGLKNGVMLFFALSGYLLYRPFVVGEVDLTRYAIHRAARILPAYWFALIGLSVVTGQRAVLEHPVSYALFGQVIDPLVWQGFVGVSWTLALEVLFYALLPAIAVVIQRSVMRLAVLATLSFVLCVVGITLTPDPRQGSSLFMLWAFAPGMAIALCEASLPRSPGLLVVGVAFLIVGTRSWWASIDLVSAVGSMLVIAWAVATRPSLRIFRPIAGAGAAASYAIYLWHVDLLLSNLLWLLPIVCVVSYLAIERPAIQWSHGVTAPWRRPQAPGPAVRVSDRDAARQVNPP